MVRHGMSGEEAGQEKSAELRKGTPDEWKLPHKPAPQRNTIQTGTKRPPQTLA